MNWKWLLPIPAAALLLGSPVKPPLSKEPLPTEKEMGCADGRPTHFYLRAYAYSRELPAVSRSLLKAAERELESCSVGTDAIMFRIRELRKTLSL